LYAAKQQNSAISKLGLQLPLIIPHRAKLEEALERMDRVVHAIERDTAQASPYTAQLAVQLDDSDAADSVSPALQQVALHHACCCAVYTLDVGVDVHSKISNCTRSLQTGSAFQGTVCASSATCFVLVVCIVSQALHNRL